MESRGYQTSDCLIGWTWGVRAFVNGQWNEWSDTRHFDVEAPNTDLAWVTTIPLTPTLTPTPATAPTEYRTQIAKTLDNILQIEGSFPFVFPFIPPYLLLFTLVGPE